MSQLPEIWSRYRALTDLTAGAAIIEDGIVDIDEWENAPRKVLILLKDPHEDDPQHAWNLAETIRDDDWADHASQKIWNTAGQMAYAIQNWSRDSFPEFPLDASAAREISQTALRKSAVVNIKKTGGGSEADDEEIHNWAQRTQSLLLEQIHEIKPQIILCGGTWPYIKKYWKRPEKIARAVYQPDESYYIDYYHPANRYPNLLNYYALGGIMLSSGLVDKVPKRM